MDILDVSQVKKMNASTRVCYKDLHHIDQTDTWLYEGEKKQQQKKQKSWNGSDLPENGWKAS